MRQITEIIVHCTATRPDWWASRRLNKKIAEVRAWHIGDRGWKDIGYHYLIDRDGKVGAGRPLERTGAHVMGRNTGTIGIALFGGHGSAETDAFADNFTPEQEVALRALIADLRQRFGAVPVTGHNAYANKACPGFNVPRWFGAAPAQRPAAPAPAAERPAPDAGAKSPLAALLSRIFAFLAKGGPA